MDGIGPDERPRIRPRRGMHQDGLILPTAQPTVAADQLLEGGDLLGPGVEATVQQDVRRVCQPVVTSEVVGGVRTEPQQGVDALDRSVGQAVRPLAPEHDRTAGPTSHQDEPDPGMLAEAGQQPGMRLLQILESQASG